MSIYAPAAYHGAPEKRLPSLMMSGLVCGSMVVAMLSWSPSFVRHAESIFETTFIPDPQPIPPDPPAPKPKAKQSEQPSHSQSRPGVDTTSSQTNVTDAGFHSDATPIQPINPNPGTGMIQPQVQPRPHVPVLVGVQMDPRFAGQMQPDYPPGLEIEGYAVVRVLVGTDGRVKSVELVRASHPAFFRETQSHALRKWRFKPATRDGIAVEGWRTMTVNFVIDS